jgi:hypothetical protein
MFGTVPFAFCAARGFSGSALCPLAGEIKEPLAQFWVSDQLGAARTFAGIFQAFCLGVHAGCSKDDGWPTAARDGGSWVPARAAQGRPHTWDGEPPNHDWLQRGGSSPVGRGVHDPARRPINQRHLMSAAAARSSPGPRRRSAQPQPDFHPLPSEQVLPAFGNG